MHRRPPLTARSPQRPAPGLPGIPGVLGAVVALGLSACSSPSLPATPQAGGSACAQALAAAPASVLGTARTTGAQPAGTAAWGDPPILLRCGLAEVGPTTTPCLSVDDVDWVVAADGDPVVATTYGRSPALELRIPARYGRENASAALVDVAAAARALPRTGRSCI